MALFPERGERTPPKDIKEVPEAPEVPEYIEKGGIKPRKTQFNAQVQDDKGKGLIHSPKTKKVTITLPTGEEELKNLSKGKTENSLTWFAKFWLRTIKRAAHFGWRVLGGGKKLDA